MPNVQLEKLPGASAEGGGGLAGLTRILRHYKPEVVHLHFTPFLSLYYWIAKMCGVRRIFFTDHSSPEEDSAITRQPAWKRLAARLLTLPLSAVTTVSEFGRDCMQRRDLIGSKKIAMIYNSVDFSRIAMASQRAAQFRERYKIPSSRCIVTQVSWMIPQKGIPDLLHAMKIVIQEQQDVHLLLVGEGTDRGKFEALSRELRITEYVTFTGGIEDPMAEGVFAASDIVCQLSRWQEVFGYVIAEAMAFAKPIVASNTGGIPELVQEGENGFLVPPGDSTIAASRILQLLRDECLRRKMGAAGLDLARAKFDLKTNVGRLMQLYQLSAPSAQA